MSSLLGHNGVGETTTTFILVGMLEATSGSVKVEGLDNRLHIQDIRRIVGFCPQYGRKKKESYFYKITVLDILYNELSVEEHLLLMGKVT